MSKTQMEAVETPCIKIKIKKRNVLPYLFSPTSQGGRGGRTVSAGVKNTGLQARVSWQLTHLLLSCDPLEYTVLPLYTLVSSSIKWGE